MRFFGKKRSADAPPVVKSKFREWTESVAFTLIFVWLFSNHIAQATEVPTESMTPTILAGDHFFLDKVAFPANYPRALQKYLPARTIHRGDIVAFWSPENPDIRLVKRVVGLPGETIEIRKRDVYIDGGKLNEPYAVHQDFHVYSTDRWVPQELQRRDNMDPRLIPPGHYFMMGDNRDNSNDSRYWGFAPLDAFIGKPTFIYWSYEVDPYEPTQQSFEDLALHYASIAQHFFTKTRWLRTGEVLR